MVRDRRKRTWNGSGNSDAPEQADASPLEAEDGLPDIDALLGADDGYLASMQRLLSVSDAFQKLLDARQLRTWLELEETFLAHLAFVQRRVYLAGQSDGREQMLAETRQKLLELLSYLLETGRRS